MEELTSELSSKGCQGELVPCLCLSGNSCGHWHSLHGAASLWSLPLSSHRVFSRYLPGSGSRCPLTTQTQLRCLTMIILTCFQMKSQSLGLWELWPWLSCGMTQFNPNRVVWFRKLKGSWVHAEPLRKVVLSTARFSLEQKHWLMRQGSSHVKEWHRMC